MRREIWRDTVIVLAAAAAGYVLAVGAFLVGAWVLDGHEVVS